MFTRALICGSVTCITHVFGGGGGGLGTQWLSTLGVIQWDFKLLTMCFTYGQKTVLLHGLKEAGSHIQEGNLFLKEPVKRALVLHIACHTTAHSTGQTTQVPT